MDLEDFFGSITAGRIYGIFRRCGYPEPVAHLLTALVTNSFLVRYGRCPGRVALTSSPRTGALASTWWARTFLKGPTSPALANLAAFGLDNRLAGLAQASGLNYSR